MDPAFPDLVGQWAADHIDDKARVWTVTRGRDGALQEGLDLDHLLKLNPGHGIDEIVDAVLSVAALEDIEDTRLW